jgi:hypothetical protein
MPPFFDATRRADAGAPLARAGDEAMDARERLGEGLDMLRGVEPQSTGQPAHEQRRLVRDHRARVDGDQRGDRDRGRLEQSQDRAAKPTTRSSSVAAAKSIVEVSATRRSRRGTRASGATG